MIERYNYSIIVTKLKKSRKKTKNLFDILIIIYYFSANDIFKKMVDAFWCVRNEFNKIAVPDKPTREEQTRKYAEVFAYSNIIKELWLDNHPDISRFDLEFMLYLYKKRYFTYEDIESLPKKTWGHTKQRKTTNYLINKGWIRIKGNHGRHKQRLFSFTPYANYEINLLFRTLFFAHSLNNSRFPVSETKQKLYYKVIKDINEIVKEIRRENKSNNT